VVQREQRQPLFLVPGLIVLVMTIIGAFLTAMVVAREWERGTLEALFVTPMRAGEFLISKLLPYFGLGMIRFRALPPGWPISLPCPAARLPFPALPRLNDIPPGRLGNRAAHIHPGQEPVPRQPVGDDLTFLPAMMLSGFLYDLRSMPVFIRGITYVLPARYAVALMQTLYLAGDVGSVVWLNLGFWRRWPRRCWF
jgi:ABC-2 type transport system permease protein